MIRSKQRLPWLLAWKLAPWRLEDVVEMTADYWRQKEDMQFEKAFEELAQPITPSPIGGK